MKSNNQSRRLTAQHLASRGVIGIFGKEAKLHDIKVGVIASEYLIKALEEEFVTLKFRVRNHLSKAEINQSLHAIDSCLGVTSFLPNSRIVPDGKIVEVMDDHGRWRVICVSEAKHQGKEIENIKAGIKTKDGKDIMTAGNAIERSHKNIAEFANFMLAEDHFPYILFLEGSNFLTQNVVVKKPDGAEIVLKYDAGNLNRIDRLTAANYGMPINTNLCENKVVNCNGKTISLQAASIYTKGDGTSWSFEELFEIMLDISRTSLKVLSSDLFEQLFNGGR